MHERTSFVTLTYGPKCVRLCERDELGECAVHDGLSLRVADWQKFAKRLRKVTPRPLRFFMCGEYGGQTLRPHFHALVFGEDFREDSVPLSTWGPGSKLRVSAALALLWPFGHHSVGAVEWSSAAYVAKYCTKKLTGKVAESAYERVDGNTGECWSVAPEFATHPRGRDGGLGAPWFERYWKDVYPDDFVVVNGRQFRPPGYYDDLLAVKDPELHSEVLQARRSHVRSEKWNYTPERMVVRERVAQAKAGLYERSTL